MPSRLQCMDCGQEYPITEIIYNCTQCGALLDVLHNWEGMTITHELFDKRLGTYETPYKSGVWRYKELIYPDVPNELIVSKPEGNTNLYPVPKLAEWAGVANLYLKHEGENPTGSFKDRGMTGGLTQARVLGMERVACASTGNTSASMAAYAATAELDGIIFLQNKAIALGKLAQGLAYGATCLRIDADFDRNLELVREVSKRLNIYVLNSINPFRLEGQKSIVIEAIQQLRWEVPDWIVVPGGNLGNSSAFGKALKEMYELKLIDRIPRLAIIQAQGASPLYNAFTKEFEDYEAVKAQTLASAIKIGNPVNYKKAVRSILWTNGWVESVTDQEILDAKALIDRSGIGCEPASGASLAGVRKLVDKGVIQPHEMVVGILSGHLLKDPDTTIGYHNNSLEGIQPQYPNQILSAGDDIEEIVALLSRGGEKAVV
jgi:threonine synthase